MVRHAHAAGAAPGAADRTRSLSPRGRRQAAGLAGAAGRLAGIAGFEKIRAPELVLCSAAARARETAEPIARTLGAELWVEEDLYLGDVDAVMACLHLVPAGTGGVVVVGHNPTVHELVLWLGRPPVPDALAATPPPATLTGLLVTGGSWSALGAGDAVVSGVFHPDHQ